MALPARAVLLMGLVGLVACDEPKPEAKPVPSGVHLNPTQAPTVAPQITPPKLLATSSGPAPTFAAPPKKEKVEGAALEVTFGFDPPIGKPFTVKRVRKKRKGRGKMMGQEEILGTTKRVVVEKSDDTFRWTFEPVAFTHHGVRRSRLDELVEGYPATLTLDGMGAVKEVAGYDDVLASAKKKLEAKNLKQMGKMLDPETLRRTQHQDWSTRVGDLVGKTMSVGKPVISTSEVALAKGSAKIYVVTRVTTWTSCALGSCVEVETAYDTDPKALEQRTKLPVAEIVEDMEKQAKGGKAKGDEAKGDKAKGHDGHDHGHEGHDHGDSHDGHDHGKANKPTGPPIAHAGLTIRLIDPATSMPVWERVERVVNIAGMASLEDEMVLTYEYGE